MSVSRILSGVLVVMAMTLSACSTEGRSYSSNTSSSNAYSANEYGADPSGTLSMSLPEVNSGN